MQNSCKPVFPGRPVRLDGCTFRVFVTNRQGDGADLWRDYNQRACCEQHIEKLKNDLQVDGFCMKDFYATESAFLSVCLTYDLLSLYQHASSPEQRGKAGFNRPATLRAAAFIGGAVLGNRSRTSVLYIAKSWGGLDKHKPLIDNILQWPGATSPKLPPEPLGDGGDRRDISGKTARSLGKNQPTLEFELNNREKRRESAVKFITSRTRYCGSQIALGNDIVLFGCRGAEVC